MYRFLPFLFALVCALLPGLGTILIDGAIPVNGLRAQDWKPAAEAAIREHRMAPLTVEIVDVDGNAVTGAKVSVRLRDPAFRWGSIVMLNEVFKLERQGFDIGSNHPYWNHLRQFTTLGAGNAGKWKQWIQDGNREKYLEVMDWMNENGINNRLHAPIWPSIRRWNAVPDFVLNATATADMTKEEVVRRHVREHLESYMPIIQDKQAYEVDLVNELLNEPDLSRQLLGLNEVDQRIAEHTQWYKWAKAAAPNVGLIANEYNLYQSGNNFHERFVDYVFKMMAQGAPIDGIGMQGHFFGPIPQYAELKRRLAEVAVLGLPMAVTEFDMVNNTYAEMERVLYSIFSEPLANNFTVWGAWDGNQWRGNAPIYNLDWSLKPSGRAWFDLVKERWWTDTTTVHTVAEPFEMIAFKGSYDLYVELDGQVIHEDFILDQETGSLRVVIGRDDAFPLPNATLSLAGDPSIVYPNQPVDLILNADAEIASVVFYDGDQIMGADREAPFNLEIIRTQAGQTINPAAEVTFASGYRQRLTADAFSIDGSNSAPEIVDLFPASGSSLLQQDNMAVTVAARDGDGDALTAILTTTDGDTLRPTGDNPFRFELGELPLGSNRLGLRIEDDKFGFVERDLLLVIVAANTTLVATAFPLGPNDDIEEKEDGSIDLTGDLDLGEKLTAIRFDQAGIPAGAIIDSAFIQFSSQKPDQTGPVSMGIYGEKALNPRQLGGGRNNLTNRIATDTRIPWPNVPDWTVLDEAGPLQRTPDLRSLITEIVEQTGWDETKAIHLFAEVGTGGSKRSAYSVDLSESDRPVLEVYYKSNTEADAPLAPVGVAFNPVGINGGLIFWQDPNPDGIVEGYNFELNGDVLPAIIRNREYDLMGLAEGLYTVRVQAIGQLGVVSEYSRPFTFRIGEREDVCGPDGMTNPIENGLMIEDLGKAYQPDPTVVPDYLQYLNADRGGTTSVRRNSPATLVWKTQGYYQRNRELGQIFNVPEGESLTLDAIVLRTGNSAKAVLSGAPGADMYIQFFEVIGTPVINDNGTPIGTESTHGFNTNHRTDDYLDGITYEPIAIVRGGTFPDIPATTQVGGEPGHLRYLRWDLQGEAELTLAGGKRYAFMVGFVENGDFKGFSLGNNNQAASGAAPALRTDPNGEFWWAIRREGDGTLPPTQIPANEAPANDSLRQALIAESLYEEDHECVLSPTTDGFPDVDTYRTLEFYIETINTCPPAGSACDDGDPETENDLTDGNCGCVGVRPGGCRADGNLTYERFEGIPGSSIEDLEGSPVFASGPTVTEEVQLFEAPSNVGDNYGARIKGYLCPPETGEYRFFSSGDNHVELRLSTDADPANVSRIIFNKESTGIREWNRFDSQRSSLMMLEAGVPYYVEALVKESNGEDHMAIGWELPSGRFEGPIPSASISTIAGDATTSVATAGVGPLAANVFPNPTTGELHVEFEYSGGPAEIPLSLHTLDGRQVYASRFAIATGRNRLDLVRPAALPSGIYLLRLITPQGGWATKVIYR